MNLLRSIHVHGRYLKIKSSVTKVNNRLREMPLEALIRSKKWRENLAGKALVFGFSFIHSYCLKRLRPVW